MPATAPAVGDEALQHWINRVRRLGGMSLQRVAAQVGCLWQPPYPDPALVFKLHLTPKKWHPEKGGSPLLDLKEFLLPTTKNGLEQLAPLSFLRSGFDSRGFFNLICHVSCVRSYFCIFIGNKVSWSKVFSSFWVHDDGNADVVVTRGRLGEKGTEFMNSLGSKPMGFRTEVFLWQFPSGTWSHVFKKR